MGTTVNTFNSRKDGVKQKVEVQGTDLPEITAPISTLTLAGSSISDGVAIPTGGSFKLSGADGTKGAVLPASVPGLQVAVRNPDGSNAAKVYPNTSSGVINNGSAGAALSVPANTACLLVALDAQNNWFSIPRVPS